jgi:predicted O-methyltransferase YrrM
MNTLTRSPVAPLLDRLFAEADAARESLGNALADVPATEQARLMRSKIDYLDLYMRLKDFPLPVSRSTGALLYMLARSGGARNVVEFGTSFGLSTIHLAAALRDNGGGRVITTEFEPGKLARARGHLEAAGLADLVEVRAGDALRTLAVDLPETVDLLLLDGAKALYPEVLALVEDRLRPGAFVVADNACLCPEYLERVRSPVSGWLSCALADDVELSLRLN